MTDQEKINLITAVVMENAVKFGLDTVSLRDLKHSISTEINRYILIKTYLKMSKKLMDYSDAGTNKLLHDLENAEVEVCKGCDENPVRCEGKLFCADCNIDHMGDEHEEKGE